MMLDFRLRDPEVRQQYIFCNFFAFRRLQTDMKLRPIDRTGLMKPSFIQAAKVADPNFILNFLRTNFAICNLLFVYYDMIATGDTRIIIHLCWGFLCSISFAPFLFLSKALYTPNYSSNNVCAMIASS